MNWEGWGRKRLWHVLYYHEICLQGLRKAQQAVVRMAVSLTRFEHNKTEMLPTEPSWSGKCSYFELLLGILTFGFTEGGRLSRSIQTK